MSGYTRQGINLDTYFQTRTTGCITAASTNILFAGSDLNARYAGRDNLASNRFTALASTGYTVGGVDISGRFNRTGAVFNVTITGTTTYSGVGQTASLSSYSPTNVVVPTITGTQTTAGTYTPANFTVGANIPTSYTKSLTGTYTIQQRVPYTAPPTVFSQEFNPNDGNVYNLYTVKSNLVALGGGPTDSISISFLSGQGYFKVGPDWSLTPHTTNTSTGGDFVESGVGTIYFGVLFGGSTATFRINAGNNTNYTIPDITIP
jgi:hypothetical protein